MSEKKITVTELVANQIPKLLDDPRGHDVLKKINKTYCVEVTGEGGGVYSIELKPNGKIYHGKTKDACCTLSADIETMRSIFENPGSAMDHFNAGRLKVDGKWHALSLRALKDIKI